MKIVLTINSDYGKNYNGIKYSFSVKKLSQNIQIYFKFDNSSKDYYEYNQKDKCEYLSKHCIIELPLDQVQLLTNMITEVLDNRVDKITSETTEKQS